MRRHHWLIAGLLLLGLWAWTQRLDNGAPPAPTQSAHAPSAEVTSDRRPPPVAARAPLATPPAEPTTRSADPAARYPAFLPPEAHAVLDAVARGGPYDHRQDGAVFQNRERRLPPQPGGYYREYTVPTPGSGDRGPRRIVTGDQPPREYWYSADHYRSFRRFDVRAGAAQ